MLTAMVLKGKSEDLAQYHCREENYYFKQATTVEEEIMELTGEYPRRAEALEYVKIHGGVAQSLGYAPGEIISEKEFVQLLDGQNRAGEKVTRLHKVKGIDLTFSAPKSVSVAGLVMDKNPAIIQAHDAAVLDVMGEVEKYFTVARNKDKQQYTTGKMCYATVRDGFSREMDPHLHTHVVVMNLTEHQGKIQGIWTRKILQRDFNKAFGELYRCRLAEKLHDLGYTITYIKNGEWRLSRVSREIEQEFSKRREQIEAKREAGINDMDAWRKTRAEKPPKANKAEIVKDWLARLGKYVVDEAVNIKNAIGERLTWSKAAEFSIEAAQERDGLRGSDNENIRWQHALRRATERCATTTKTELIYEYLKETMRAEKWEKITYAEAARRLYEQQQAGYIVAVKEGYNDRYTSLELIMAERDYMRYAGAAGPIDYSITGRDAAYYLKNVNEFNRRRGRKVLSDVQGRAVYELLTSKRLIDCLQGDAGAGKTTSLKAVAENYRQRGIDVIGLAMQGVAAKKLADEAGIEAMTLKSYLGRRNTPGQKVLIFDEASMLDSRSAARLFKRAKDAGDKIILVGDRNQLESINAGKVFERYVDFYSKPGAADGKQQLVVMNENYRQRDPVLREAVTLAKQGAMEDSLGLLEKNGHIAEIEDTDTRRAAVAELYNKDTLIIVSTTAARDEINKRIRDGLQDADRLQPGRTYTMARADEEGIDHPRSVALAAGDIICFTKNEYENYDIRNGEKAEVLECGAKFLKVRTEDKRELKINTEEYRNIDYGYALTTYKSQGQTYNSVVVESDTRVPDLVDMRNQYVNITRARDQIKIFTDDIEGLTDLAGIKTHARDTLDLDLDIEKIRQKREELAFGLQMPQAEESPERSQEGPQLEA